MALHTLNRTIRILSPAAVFLFTFFAAANMVMAQAEATIELPPITVFAKKQADNSYVQTVAVAWQDANDPTIVRQKDDTYTASSTTNSYSIMAFLASDGRPALNIDIAYATNSVSMTAEGSSIVTTLIEGLAYFDQGVSLELTPFFNNAERASRIAMQRRLEILRKSLERNERVKLKIVPPKNVASGAKAATQSDVWRVQIRRAI